ncbi:MAG: SGNH/GDSL hydrolase family protein [Clostridia bacterium]|nr:SGNH/GDSL hydrolase family protein [Clostridia bacterium]
MELKGLTINFLGDSITAGSGTSDWENKTFLALLGKNEGATVRNYGVGGSRIARQLGVSEFIGGECDFVMREEEMERDADIIVVFGGTNDYGHGNVRFGTMSDRDVYTFYGATHTLIQNLMEHNPKATIVFMTPLHRLEEDAHDGKPCLREYRNAIKEVCEYYSIPVLDLYAVGGMQPHVEVQRNLYMPDGLHPNDLGHEIICSRLTGFLKSL